MATPAVPPLTRLTGKGRQPASIERIRDLEDEITALTAERLQVADIGDEIEALSRRHPSRQARRGDACGRSAGSAGPFAPAARRGMTRPCNSAGHQCPRDAVLVAPDPYSKGGTL